MGDGVMDDGLDEGSDEWIADAADRHLNFKFFVFVS